MIYLDTHLRMPLSHPETKHLQECLTRENPAVAEAAKLGFSTATIEPYLKEYKVRGDEVLFPRYWFHELSNKAQGQVSDFRTVGEMPGLHFTDSAAINLRPYQKQPVKDLLDELRYNGGVTLNALMGTGKTVVALEVARTMRLKTLVLVHTEFLMNQWVDRAKEFLGVDATIIQGDTCDTDSSLVIGMIQTLNSRQYDHLRDMFGLIIVDEAHRASAPVFSSVIQQFNGRYRMGMTGTKERRDGLEWIFFSHIGSPNVTMERSADFKVDPQIYFNQVPYMPPPQGGFIKRGVFQHAAFITALGKYKRRNEHIAAIIAEAAENGRNIIVFSDRRDHLGTLAEMMEQILARKGVTVSYGFLVGGMKEEDQAKAQQQQVIFCTYQLASEALDVPRLDTAFLTTPKKNVQQAVGRIERKLEGKKQPIVMDFVDEHYGVARGLAKHRARYYHKRGWKTQ